jgi:hypothetical protein
LASRPDARDKWEVTLTADLRRTLDALRAIGPEDAAELARLFEGAGRLADLNPHVDRPPELATLSDRLRGFWDLRDSVGTFLHFRKPIGTWINDDLRYPQLRCSGACFRPKPRPLFLLMVLGYLARDGCRGRKGARRDSVTR